MSVNLRIGMMITMLVAKEFGRQHYDKTTVGTNQIIEPARAKGSKMGTLVLQRKMMYEQHAMDKHRGHNPPRSHA